MFFIKYNKKELIRQNSKQTHKIQAWVFFVIRFNRHKNSQFLLKKLLKFFPNYYESVTAYGQFKKQGCQEL
jgi:hypothetical protein